MTFYVVKKSRGDGVRDRTYSGYFRLPWMKKVKFVPLGVTEKVVALKLLLDFVRNEQLRFSGFIVDTVSGSEKSLEFYLSEFLLSVSGRLRGKQYISRLRLSIFTISSFCGWKFPSEITSSGFEKWRSSSTLSPKSKNFYQSSFSSFCSWLVNSRVLKFNPFDSVSYINLNRVDRLHRHSLSLLQCRSLISVLPDSRLKLIVLLALYTGLRRKEISSLVWSDFNFSSSPFILLRSQVSKNGKSSVIPLRSDLSDLLFDFMKTSNSDLVFGKFPPFNRLKKFWLQAGVPDDPSYDFHSLRVTFCTFLEKTGAPPRVAQEAMRHSDSRLTEHIYTDSDKLDVRSAVNSLPSFFDK